MTTRPRETVPAAPLSQRTVRGAREPRFPRARPIVLADLLDDAVLPVLGKDRPVGWKSASLASRRAWLARARASEQVLYEFEFEFRFPAATEVAPGARPWAAGDYCTYPLPDGAQVAGVLTAELAAQLNRSTMHPAPGSMEDEDA